MSNGEQGIAILLVSPRGESISILKSDKNTKLLTVTHLFYPLVIRVGFFDS